MGKIKGIFLALVFAAGLGSMTGGCGPYGSAAGVIIPTMLVGGGIAVATVGISQYEMRKSMEAMQKANAENTKAMAEANAKMNAAAEKERISAEHHAACDTLLGRAKNLHEPDIRELALKNYAAHCADIDWAAEK